MNLIQYFMGRVVPFRVKKRISKGPHADLMDQALRKEQMELKKALTASRDERIAQRLFNESFY